MEWIDVKDRMPEEGSMVLVVHATLHAFFPVLCCFYQGEFTLDAHSHHLPSMVSIRATHWAPIPHYAC